MQKIIQIFLISLLFLCIQAQTKDVSMITPDGNQFQLAGQKYQLNYVEGADFSCHKNFCFSPDRKEAFLWQKGIVTVLNTTSWQKIFSFDSLFPALAATSDQKYAIVRNQEGKHLLQKIGEEKLCPIFGAQENDTSNGWWFYDKTMAISMKTKANEITIFSTSTNEKSTVAPQGIPSDICWQGIPSADQKTIYFGSNGFLSNGSTASYIFTLDCQNAQIKNRRHVNAQYAYPFALSPDGEHFYSGYDRIYMIHGQTLDIMGKSPVIGRIFWAGLTPANDALYVITSFDGLYILDPNSLKVKLRYPVGQTSNAFSLGVIFSEEGKMACVATPYKNRLSLIETSTHGLYANIQVEPSCGAFFISASPVGQCFVFPVSLPYE